jgi:hypothetical protein
MIDIILIPLRYNFFFESPTAKNSGVKRAWPGAIFRMGDRSRSFSGCAKVRTKVHLKD